MANDIAGQAQANWFKQANMQSNNPRRAGETTQQQKPMPKILRAAQPMPAPTPIHPGGPIGVGGLFGSSMGMPQNFSPSSNGGLMDFNALASQLSGSPGPRMDDRAALIRQIFGQGLPGQMAKDTGSGRDRDKERKLFMIDPITGVANWTNQQLGWPSLF
jgi:hypothetical protein